MLTERTFDIEINVTHYEPAEESTGSRMVIEYDAFVLIGKGKIKLPIEVAAEFMDEVEEYAKSESFERLQEVRAELKGMCEGFNAQIDSFRSMEDVARMLGLRRV